MSHAGARPDRVIELDLPHWVLRRLAASDPQRHPVLLDSASGGPLGGLSLLCGPPSACLWLGADGRLGSTGAVTRGAGFLDSLEHWFRAERAGTEDPHLPFAGGWMLYCGYELAREIEPRLELPAAAFPWTAFALRVRSALLARTDRPGLLAVAEPGAEEEREVLVRSARAAAARGPLLPAVPAIVARHEEPAERYLEQVRSAQEHVRAGDVYQANLARAWRIEFEHEPDAGALYARLCAANPAPFAALAHFQGAAILSSSPERLVRVSAGQVDTRPIAGTRPRRGAAGEDSAMRAELASNPKERAEHVMLIDLERNDLGRVCEPGSVRVDEFMSIESYAHVHHIVSNVTGRLRAEVSPIGALRAVFPGGTITGCPKFRCMQLIAELEAAGRGAYTGSLGYLSRCGRMDLNILIRTVTLLGRQVEFRAGAGIVADSDPERELEETRAKARGMLAAFGAEP